MGMSLLEKVAKLPEEERSAFLDDLSAEEVAILHGWRGQARPEQMPPGGEWSYWALLGGRGSGKSRAAAEWVLDRIEGIRPDGTPMSPKSRANSIGFIGRTSGDVRRVMVEGEESGFIVCAERRGLAVKFNPSRAQLMVYCPDGHEAKVVLFSADEPDSLRGPQHDTLWCLPAGTMVSTPTGTTAIEGMVPGDTVLTRDGTGTVRWAGMTRRDAVLVEIRHSEGVLRCTPDHRIWVHGRGWVWAADLRPGDTLMGPASHPLSESAKPAISFSPPQWLGSARAGVDGAVGTAGTAKSTSSNGTVGGGTASTLGANSPSIGSIVTATCCIERSMCTTSAPFPMGTMSTIVTGSLSTTTRRTLWRSLRLSILRVTGHVASRPGASSSDHRPLGNSGRPGNRPNAPALFAGPRTSRWLRRASTAAETVTEPKVVAVTTLPSRADTYDLTIEGRPEFFADGVLVHNSDEFAAWPRKTDAVGNTALKLAQAGLRLGEHPQGVFSTTPRPTVEVKNVVHDTTGAWALTRMTTWDNAANLAPAFIEVLQAQYGGTTMAQQEFEGMLIEAVEGALWTPERINNTRVIPGFVRWEGAPAQVFPTLIHRAVALDPSVAFKGEGDECGIVTGGVGQDLRMYVTGDYSLSASPDDWAREAVRAYHQTGATVIIAEGNQGYALISSVIKSVDASVPVEIVHASDGKRARAEPIAQWWEPGQQRASIVGSWPLLEEQLTQWSSRENESPDRLDAMVWLGHWAKSRMFALPASFRLTSSRKVPDPLSN